MPTTPLRFVMGSTPEKSINCTSPQTKYGTRETNIIRIFTVYPNPPKRTISDLPLLDSFFFIRPKERFPEIRQG